MFPGQMFRLGALRRVDKLFLAEQSPNTQFKHCTRKMGTSATYLQAWSVLQSAMSTFL